VVRILGWIVGVVLGCVEEAVRGKERIRNPGDGFGAEIRTGYWKIAGEVPFVGRGQRGSGADGSKRKILLRLIALALLSRSVDTYNPPLELGPAKVMPSESGLPTPPG